MRGLVVGDGRQLLDVRTCGGERDRQQDAVGVVDLARAERLAWTPQLGARSEHRNVRTARAGHMLQAGRSESSDLRRTQPAAARDDHFARTNVATARTNVLAHDKSSGNLDLVVTLDNVLDGDDGVRALGDDAPC